MKLEERLGRRKQEARAGLEAARSRNVAARLWARDLSLFPDPSAAKDRLGWLDGPRFAREHADELASFAKEAAASFSHCLLLGMGGSSECPRVLARFFGRREGGMDVRVLDSTAPDAVRAAARGFDLGRTLFLVSSKSGTTAETDAYYRHYRSQIDDGGHFVAITDPGTPLQRLAEQEGFRRTFLNPPDVGGRDSALSFFGLVPAALLGLDVGLLAGEAEKAALESAPGVPLEENVAFRLGAIAAGLARAGADKLTLLPSPALRPFGPWIEQLVAESTGKGGRGLVPVDGEPAGKKGAYGTDRLFVSLALSGEAHDMSSLAESGHTVVQWKLPSPEALAGEFLRWELAAATMGALLDLDPFVEPDVEASKEKTRSLLEAPGPAPEPSLRAGDLQLFAAADHAQILRKASGFLGAKAAASPEGWIAAHLALADPGDYVALLAFLVETDELRRELNAVQGAIRNATKLASTLGFGPRFLHSTGQLHKGGPATGIFLQLTCDGGEELPIPGRPYGFRTLFAAQARGDFEALQARGRRILRVHGDAKGIVEALHSAVKLLSK